MTLGTPRMLRKTLSRETGPLSGPGLFSGEDCSVNIRPSPAATGILFTPPGRSPVSVGVSRCVEWRPRGWPAGVPIRNTSVGVGGWSVGTVEHLLSALAGLGVTDAIVEVQGPEVPILDGSALPFVEAVGPITAELDRTVEPLTPRGRVEVRDGGGGVITLSPRPEGTLLTYALDYGEGSCIPAQSASWSGDAGAYAREIAPARTFSLEAEAQAAARAGLFARFSARDMLVIGGDGRPIDNAWRCDAEPARHKLLDLIGDLALLGRPLHAAVTASRSGHALTRELCREVLRLAAGG